MRFLGNGAVNYRRPLANLIYVGGIREVKSAQQNIQERWLKRHLFIGANW
jgi:hypothetical protein